MDKTDLLQLIKSEQEVKNVLLEIKAEVAKIHKNCNISKTVGSSVSAAGTVTTIVGIFLAPVTGGLSLGLTIGGLAATVAGAGTNVTTEAVNISKNKKYAKRLQKVLQERQNEYIRVGEKILKNALRDDLFLAGKGAYFVGSTVFKVCDVTKTLIFLFKARKILLIAKHATHISAHKLSVSTCYSGLLKTLGVTGFRLGAKCLFAGVGVAGIAWDAFRVTKDWLSTPDLCEKIDKIIIELDKKIKELEERMDNKDGS